MFCDQLDYNLWFRWFLDTEMDEAAFDASTFSNNRKRLIDNEIGKAFLASVVARQAFADGVVGSPSVDGTLIEAWASMKSFRRKDDDGPPDSNGWSDFRDEKRSNWTHESKTDPESRLARKATGAEGSCVSTPLALGRTATGRSSSGRQASRMGVRRATRRLTSFRI